jgi:hypothetical protein
VIVASPDAGPGEIRTISSVQNPAAQKVAWVIPGRGTLTYAECTSGCATLAPSFTSATILSAAVVSASIAARPNGGVAAAALSETMNRFDLLYGECSMGCLTSTNWTWTVVDNDVDDVTPRIVAAPGLTAIAYAAANDSNYAECFGGCTLATAWTSDKPFPDSLAARPGLAVSMPVRGYVNANGEYGRCAQASCTAGPGNWARIGTTAPAGEGGAMHFNDAGVPRVFGQALGAIRESRCMTAPCTSPLNFTGVLVTTGVSRSTQLDVAFDGQERGAIVYPSSFGSNPGLSTAREGPDGGWTTSAFPACGSPFVGVFPVAELTSSGQLRAFFHATPTRDIRYYVAP